MRRERKPAITKIQIVSNNIPYGACPEPEDEAEQLPVIERDGQVAITRYAYDPDAGASSYPTRTLRT